MLISRRQQSAAAPIEVAGNVEAPPERDRLLVSANRSHQLAVQDRGALGVDEDVGELFDIARITDRAGRGSIVARLGHHGLGYVDFAIEYVARNLQVDRTGRTVESLADSH